MPTYIYNPYSILRHEVDDLTGMPFCGSNVYDRAYTKRKPQGDYRECFKCKQIKKARAKKKRAEKKKEKSLLHCAYDPIEMITHQEVKGGVTYCGVDPTNFIRRKLKTRPRHFAFCEKCEERKLEGRTGYR